MLDPCAAIYGAVTNLRNRAYDSGLFESTRVTLPVVSIGNLVVGGSGKSPFTAYTCEQLLALGRAPVILMRGYGGSDPGPLLVNSDCSPERAGDEAVMHYECFQGNVPVVVSRRRVDGARFIAENELGDVIVLDDGFQHRALKRDLDLVLADITGSSLSEYLKQARLLPFGRFRENPDAALARAQALITIERWPHGADLQPADEAQYLEFSIPVWRFALRPSCFRSYSAAGGYEAGEVCLEDLRGQETVVLSAIASHKGFREMLHQLGVIVREEQHFPDHHQYRAKDLSPYFSGASARVPLITTAKDAVKLRAQLPLGTKILVLKLSGEFLKAADEEQFVSGLSSLPSL